MAVSPIIFTYPSPAGQTYKITPETNSATPDQQVLDTLDWVKQLWIIYLGYGGGDRIGAAIPSGREYTVTFDDTQLSNAFADPTGMTVGPGLYGSANNDGYRRLLGHELFHSYQLNTVSGNQIGSSFREGGADIGSYLSIPDTRSAIGIDSYEVYMDNPGETMWDRPTPGRVESSLSTPTFWWLYFCEQLGERDEEPGYRIDALLGIMDRPMNMSGSWQFEGDHEIERIGRFTGGDDTQILMRKQDSSALGLVSANRSYGDKGATHAILSENERWGANGWRFRGVDRFVGVGELLGNGRDQLVVQSESPSHLGIVGFTKSDGSPRHRVQWESYQSVSAGYRWGNGWMFNSDDEVVAVDRFAESDRASILIKSNSSLGVLGVNSAGEEVSVTSVWRGNTLGRDGWLFEPTDNIIGSGDFLGTGRTQFIIQRRDPHTLGFVGLDDEDRFVTYQILSSASRDRFGNGWRLREGDRVLGTGRFVKSDRSHVVLQSEGPAYLGVVGFTEDGETESVHSVSAGHEFSSEWVWEPDYELAAIGDIVGTGKQQMAFLSIAAKQLALIGFTDSAEPVTHERARELHGRAIFPGLRAVFGAGDFAGRGNDQLLQLYNDDLHVVTFEEPHILERNPSGSVDRNATHHGNWRRRFGHRINDMFYSTHQHLDAFVRNVSGGNKTLESIFRDFTVINVVKDMPQAPDRWSYGIHVEPYSVPMETLPISGESEFLVNRWAARYFKVDPSTVSLESDATSLLYWTLIVSDASDKHKSTTLLESPDTISNIVRNVDTGDQIVIVVTGTYASGKVSFRTNN